MKIIRKIALLLLCLSMLTGCSPIAGGDDLLQPPKPSKNFTLLQDQLEEIISEGKTYVTPQGGAYRNTVTFEDIDGDEVDEAIAFFRDGTGGSIYAYAFAKRDGEYEKIGSIQGPGSAVGSLAFLNGEKGRKLLVLTWTLSGDVKQGLTICGIQHQKLKELMDTTCTDYSLCDMDDDGVQELLTLSYEGTERKSAQVYDYADEKMLLLSQADATQDVQAVANITQGKMTENSRRAVFVDNKFENDNGMQTDIYVLDGTTLRNVAVSSNTSTYRSTALYYCQDIDKDECIEVPQLSPLPGYEERESAETMWMVDWYRYNMSEAVLAHTTFDSPAEGWLLEFADGWRDNVTAELVTSAGSSQTVFTETDKKDEPILTIYVFTGEDRKEAAAVEGLITLGSTTDVCYAAKLGDDSSVFSLTEKQVRRAFTIITSEWK